MVRYVVLGFGVRLGGFGRFGYILLVLHSFFYLCSCLDGGTKAMILGAGNC